MQSDNASTPETEAPSPKASKNKIFLIVGIVVLAVIMIIGIAFALTRVFQGILSNAGGQIEDSNGDENYALCTLTDQDILNSDSTAVILGISESVSGQTSGITDRVLAEVDGDLVSMQLGKMSGVLPLQATLAKSNSLLLTITSEVTQGNCRIVIVIDGEYYCDVDINETKEFLLNNVKDKTVIVKLAGESAKIKATVSRSTVQD